MEQLINKPKHIAIIMDGNGRWATNKGKLRMFGHQAGIQPLHNVVSTSIEYKLDELTVFAFSSENWKRSIDEVSNLMSLFAKTLKKETTELHKYNVKLRIIGDMSKFNEKLQNIIFESMELTKNNSGLTLNIACNYGGRWDITQTCKKIANQILYNEISPNQIDENYFKQEILNNSVGDVDLLIRTGGELRISNFLLWQLSYAELYFTNTLWPDFDKKEFIEILQSFSSKERRFGATN